MSFQVHGGNRSQNHLSSLSSVANHGEIASKATLKEGHRRNKTLFVSFFFMSVIVKIIYYGRLQMLRYVNI